MQGPGGPRTLEEEGRRLRKRAMGKRDHREIYLSPGGEGWAMAA